MDFFGVLHIFCTILLFNKTFQVVLRRKSKTLFEGFTEGVHRGVIQHFGYFTDLKSIFAHKQSCYFKLFFSVIRREGIRSGFLIQGGNIAIAIAHYLGKLVEVFHCVNMSINIIHKTVAQRFGGGKMSDARWGVFLTKASHGIDKNLGKNIFKKLLRAKKLAVKF